MNNIQLCTVLVTVLSTHYTPTSQYSNIFSYVTIIYIHIMVTDVYESNCSLTKSDSDRELASIFGAIPRFTNAPPPNVTNATGGVYKPVGAHIDPVQR